MHVLLCRPILDLSLRTNSHFEFKELDSWQDNHQPWCFPSWPFTIMARRNPRMQPRPSFLCPWFPLKPGLLMLWVHPQISTKHWWLSWVSLPDAVPPWHQRSKIHAQVGWRHLPHYHKHEWTWPLHQPRLKFKSRPSMDMALTPSDLAWVPMPWLLIAHATLLSMLKTTIQTPPLEPRISPILSLTSTRTSTSKTLSSTSSKPWFPQTSFTPPKSTCAASATSPLTWRSAISSTTRTTSSWSTSSPVSHVYHLVHPGFDRTYQSIADTYIGKACMACF